MESDLVTQVQSPESPKTPTSRQDTALPACAEGEQVAVDGDSIMQHGTDSSADRPSSPAPAYPSLSRTSISAVLETPLAADSNADVNDTRVSEHDTGSIIGQTDIGLCDSPKAAEAGQTSREMNAPGIPGGDTVSLHTSSESVEADQIALRSATSGEMMETSSQDAHDKESVYHNNPFAKPTQSLNVDGSDIAPNTEPPSPHQNEVQMGEPESNATQSQLSSRGLSEFHRPTVSFTSTDTPMPSAPLPVAASEPPPTPPPAYSCIDRGSSDAEPVVDEAADAALARQLQMEPPTPEPRPLEHAVQDEYKVRWISCKGHKYPVIMQSHNGPCPLLAVANALALLGKIELPQNVQKISFEQLAQILSMRLLDSAATMVEPHRTAFEASVSTLMEIFPKLTNGLDVNIKFTSPTGFEFTQGLELFDLFGINLYHGWLVDPQEVTAAAAIGSHGYNALLEMCIDGTSTDGLIVRHWLETNKSQLTYHGVCEIQRIMANREMAVLFRNNHYATMFKVNDCLYTLATDSGFQGTTVMWKALSCVDGGEDVYVGADFKALRSDGGSSTMMAGNVTATDGDEQMAWRLHQQELAGRSATTAIQSPPPRHLSDAELARRMYEEELAARSTSAPATLATRPVTDAELAAQLQAQENARAQRGRRPVHPSSGPRGPRNKKDTGCVVM